MSSREKTGRAIVLRVLPRGEDDLLCDLFSRELGRIWGIGRSARKSQKRFGSVLSSLNILSVTFEEKYHRFFLKEAVIARSLPRLWETLPRLSTAFYMIESIREMTPERAPEPNRFDLLEKSLAALDQGTDPRQVQRKFERVLLQLSGLFPHLENCLRCGEKKERYYFVYAEGAVFCQRCLSPRATFQRVNVGEEEELFTPFLEYCMGKKLRSRALWHP